MVKVAPTLDKQDGGHDPEGAVPAARLAPLATTAAPASGPEAPLPAPAPATVPAPSPSPPSSGGGNKAPSLAPYAAAAPAPSPPPAPPPPPPPPAPAAPAAAAKQQPHVPLEQSRAASRRAAAAAASLPLPCGSEFLDEPIDLSAKPVGFDMSGYDYAARGPKMVLMSPHVSRVIEVDTVAQTATLLFACQMDWLDDGILKRGKDWTCTSGEESGYVLADPGATGPKAMFRPQMQFMNMLEGVTELDNDTVECLRVRDRPVVGEHLSQIVRLACPMDLREFPFDEQRLPVSLSSEWWTHDMMGVSVQRTNDPAADLASGLFIDGAAAEAACPGFRFTGVSFSRRDHNHAFCAHYSDQTSVYSVVTMWLHVRRQPGYYLLRIVAVLGLVGVLKVCAFLVPLTDYATKMSWDGTLFLTLVAFNYVVANEVPKVSYPTRLDGLVLCLNLLMVASILAEVLLAYLASSGGDAWADRGHELRLAETGCIAAYFAAMAAAFTWFMWRYVRQRWREWRQRRRLERRPLGSKAEEGA